MMRKQYTAAFKARVVQEILKEDEQQLTELYAEIGKLTTQVAWLKKKLQL